MADKTLEEIKSDILHRAGRINPFERVKKADVEQVVENLTSLDSDLWGREWGKYGAKYEALADEQEKLGKEERSRRDLLLGIRVLSDRPLPGAEQPGENDLLPGRAAHVSQGGADHGPAAGAHRNSL